MSSSSVKAKLVEELHAPAGRNFPRRRVIVRGFDDLWQADLVDLQAYARENRGQRYILTVIDVFSKYAWAVPAKSKGASDVTVAFAGILRADGRVPKNLQTDMGKEFYNKDFQDCLKKKHGINHYSTFSIMKASVVERFNRTLKNAMWKSFSLNGSYRWTNILAELVSNYNRRKHRTIQMRPIDVTRDDEKHLLATAYSSSKKNIRPAKFKIGDKVRISRFKTVFDKGYTPNWSAEVFEISGVKRTNPVAYFLKDFKGDPIAGGFYELELHEATHPDVHLVERVLRTKGDRMYVKWLGYDKRHNSWIMKKDIA